MWLISLVRLPREVITSDSPASASPYLPAGQNLPCSSDTRPVSSEQNMGQWLAYGLDGRGITVRLPAAERDFVFYKASRTGLRLNQLPFQWVLEAFPRRCSGRRVYMIIHLHLVRRLKTYGATPPLSPPVFVPCSGTL